MPKKIFLAIHLSLNTVFNVHAQGNALNLRENNLFTRLPKIPWLDVCLTFEGERMCFTWL